MYLNETVCESKSYPVAEVIRAHKVYAAYNEGSQIGVTLEAEFLSNYQVLVIMHVAIKNSNT